MIYIKILNSQINNKGIANSTIINKFSKNIKMFFKIVTISWNKINLHKISSKKNSLRADQDFKVLKDDIKKNWVNNIQFIGEWI